MKTNKKGFTLVEIIVSIAVGSIVLMIAGAIILSSSQFLSTTTEMDLDKRCVDSIVDFVRGEIEYSTETRLVQQNSSKAPEVGKDGWHSFYVKDKVLYRDDVQVFQDEFYSYKEFRLAVKGHFENESRIDLYYELYNTKGEKAYSTRDTVMLLNVKVSDEMKSEGLFTQEKQQLTGAIDGYALYYRKTSMSLPSGGNGDSDDSVTTGTVADQIKFLNVYNNRNSLIDSNMNANGKYINQYEFVYFDGYWWQLLDQSNYYGYDSEKPDEVYKFKRISMEFCYASAYEAGDIVKYNNNYYYCTQRMVSNGLAKDNEGYYPLDGSWRGNTYWRKANDGDFKNSDGSYKDGSTHIDQNRANQSANKYDTTILSKIKNLNCEKAIEFNVANNASIAVVDRKKGIQQSDLYKVTEKDNITNTKKIRYFIKLFETTQLPGEGSSGNIGWQEITMDYVPNSAYMEGDIVNQPYTVNKEGNISMQAGILLCIKDVKFMSDLTKDIQYSSNDTISRWKFI